MPLSYNARKIQNLKGAENKRKFCWFFVLGLFVFDASLIL